MTERRFFEFEKVWHVGRYPAPRPGGPRRLSYEGDGLSVSVDPQDWAQIAELESTRLISLRRIDGRPIRLFGAYGGKAEIEVWAVSAGLAVRGREYVADHAAYLSREAAQRARPPYGRIVERDAVLPSAAFEARLRAIYPESGHRDQAHGAFDGEMAARYSVTLADCDGTWWASRYDPEGLSAPAGLIIPERLALMRVTEEGEVE